MAVSKVKLSWRLAEVPRSLTSLVAHAVAVISRNGTLRAVAVLNVLARMLRHRSKRSESRTSDAPRTVTIHLRNIETLRRGERRRATVKLAVKGLLHRRLSGSAHHGRRMANVNVVDGLRPRIKVSRRVESHWYSNTITIPALFVAGLAVIVMRD